MGLHALQTAGLSRRQARTRDDDALTKLVVLRAAGAPKHLHHVQRRQLAPRAHLRVVHLPGNRLSFSVQCCRVGFGLQGLQRAAVWWTRSIGGESHTMHIVSMSRSGKGSCRIWAGRQRAARLRALDDDLVRGQVDAPGQRRRGHQHLQKWCHRA